MRKSPETYSIWIISTELVALFMTLWFFREWCLAGEWLSLGRRKEDLSVECLAPYYVIFLVCFIFQSLVAPLQFFHCFVISSDIIDYLYGAIRKKQIPLISTLCLVIIFITASDKASIVNSSRNVPFIKKCLSWKLTLADPF